MRDLLVLFIIFGSLPAILARPHIGILVWTWVSLMSPHRLTWDYAYSFPFAKIVGATTIVATIFSTQPKRFPHARETWLLSLFVLWMLITTLLALEPDAAWQQWDKVYKIQLMILVTMVVITDRVKLELFIWMIALSIGFYGVKGGVFTVVRGGYSHVFGPPGSFIADNNHLGLALIMVIPLMRYLQLRHRQRWVRWGLAGAMVLTGIAILGTQSRGAFLGAAAMLAYLAWKSRRRVMLLFTGAVVIPVAFAIMPDVWFERMETIRDYEQDSSAMGRINAWWFATRLALDRPLVGGGFEVFTERWFSVYAPDPTRANDAHSIYFEVLGEHGFVGLALFLALAASMWRSCSRMSRFAKKNENTMWISDLAKMCQVMVFGYAVAGAFVGLAYFDLYYNIIAIVVVSKLILAEQIAIRAADAGEDADEASPVQRGWRDRLTPVPR